VRPWRRGAFARVMTHRQARTDIARVGSHYDRVAAHYDEQVNGLPLNRLIRDVFRQRVATLVPHSGTLLDFGCGTGTDAAWYAERGYRVIAYDISSAMVDVLRARCSADIAQGRIVPVVGGLRELDETLQGCSSLDGIAANFAVLNHLHDLRPLFETLASRLRPDAPLVASLLNPLHGATLRRPGWWRVIALSRVTGRVVTRGAVTTYRHFVWMIRRMARRYFHVAEVARIDEAGRWLPALRTWRDATRDEFYFVVLRRHT
jgi:SAM-dependent methyltransferase